MDTLCEEQTRIWAIIYWNICSKTDQKIIHNSLEKCTQTNAESMNQQVKIIFISMTFMELFLQLDRRVAGTFFRTSHFIFSGIIYTGWNDLRLNKCFWD